MAHHMTKLTEFIKYSPAFLRDHGWTLRWHLHGHLQQKKFVTVSSQEVSNTKRCRTGVRRSQEERKKILPSTE